MADDLGYGDVGYNGHPIIKTPNLDAMSREGLRFDRFYAPTVCSPTRGSVLTGRHPFRYGIFTANAGPAENEDIPSKYILRHEEITLAEALKTAGYSTAHFGKWHLGDFKGPKKSSPDEHGFDHWFSTVRKVQTLDPDFYYEDGHRVPGPLKGDDSEVIMDRALKFIRASAADHKPFLTLIWFHSPHEPTLASHDYRAMYSKYPEKEQQYYGTVTATDAQMGRLRTELRTLGIADNTLLWFCSDNGPWPNNPGSTAGLRGHKGQLWEGGIRMPAILEWPAVIKHPRTTAVPINSEDFYPTILDYLAITMPHQPKLDGISLRPLIDGDGSAMPQRSHPMGFELGNMAAWMDDRYKLVAILQGPADGEEGGGKKTKGRGKAAGQWRPIEKLTLYDLLADPKEQHDLSTEKPDVLNSMRSSLESWRHSCQESFAGKDYTNPNQH